MSKSVSARRLNENSPTKEFQIPQANQTNAYALFEDDWCFAGRCTICHLHQLFGDLFATRAGVVGGGGVDSARNVG
ncbi:hypothetical protein CEXT_643081 [Caerostris extrusa]|uniref:Uncharacterized protein n=1 Tax=Caerostris extrusa TaxID=172846 RepID=A0AAV4XM73_CAEEX|nr:hypothetical protein CEXT_643081 [Caerostris extrusa]